jgi:hypothetical protein
MTLYRPGIRRVRSSMLSKGMPSRISSRSPPKTGHTSNLPRPVRPAGPRHHRPQVRERISPCFHSKSQVMGIGPKRAPLKQNLVLLDGHFVCFIEKMQLVHICLKSQSLANLIF